LGINSSPPAKRLEDEIAHGQSDQIGRNWLRHSKAKLSHRSNESWKPAWNASHCVAWELRSVDLKITLGTHHCLEILRNSNVGVIRHAYRRSVLKWNPRSGVDGLRLA